MVGEPIVDPYCMVKIIANAMMTFKMGYEDVMRTPFRPLSMVLMIIANEGKSPIEAKQQEINLATDPRWAERIIKQAELEEIG